MIDGVGLVFGPGIALNVQYEAPCSSYWKFSLWTKKQITSSKHRNLVGASMNGAYSISILGERSDRLKIMSHIQNEHR